MIRFGGTSLHQLGLFKQIHASTFPNIHPLSIPAKSRLAVPALRKLSRRAHSTTTGDHPFRLYSYFRSSCSARLHIVLALKVSS
jgi:hypothetical protein